MAFRYEADMTPAVERWLQSRGLATKREFATPWGICDLVGVALNKHKVKQRLRLRQRSRIGPPLRIAILKEIPDREDGSSCRLEEVAAKFGRFFSVDDIAYHVSRLVAGRFVVPTAEGRLQKINGWMPLHRRIVAVELKLDRVTEVVAQASEHRAFADETYVALPMPIARRIYGDERRDDLRERGVGLLAVRGDECRCLMRARRRPTRVDTVFQAHCVERFWRSR